MVKVENVIWKDGKDDVHIDERWVEDIDQRIGESMEYMYAKRSHEAKNIYGNPVDLSVLVKVFESIIVDVVEGRYALEEVTVDTGLFRTVFKLSIMKEPVRTLPLIRPEVLGQIYIEPRPESTCTQGGCS